MRYHVYQFLDKTDNFEFFDLNLGKLPNYVQYFGSNIVESVAESWVEVDGAGWRWVHGLVIPIEEILTVKLHFLCIVDVHLLPYLCQYWQVQSTLTA